MWIKAPPGDQANYLERILLKKHPGADTGHWHSKNQPAEPVGRYAATGQPDPSANRVSGCDINMSNEKLVWWAKVGDLRKINLASADIPASSPLESILSVINPAGKNRPVHAARTPSDNCSMIASQSWEMCNTLAQTWKWVFFIFHAR